MSRGGRTQETDDCGSTCRVGSGMRPALRFGALLGSEGMLPGRLLWSGGQRHEPRSGIHDRVAQLDCSMTRSSPARLRLLTVCSPRRKRHPPLSNPTPPHNSTHKRSRRFARSHLATDVHVYAL